ncbi:unnamed protein product [Didymodactylos carnosus]|uniref:Uncharacterized protein n=1 Tax=Didymodactylos carnosus TaxID=1234261 RepID=A0A814K845_9BILA|nr:unnamed protein product [Didymodactylos carnosus]CAF1047424.1 unnamed protein product [Didymodactylos carnosus]CAF3770283.1 unnamed protein product [Didymodactylos carnosus]CAF3817172.1 unnamed protein product [Didymodactylos carnosus]
MQLQERVLQLMKESLDTLSLTFEEFCHIRNVITRAELETLLFDRKLYIEVAQGKLCFTCRKIHFNLLTLTFGIQCRICKQRVCKSCTTQIALPVEKLNDIPVQTFTPSTFSKPFPLANQQKYHSFETKSPGTPMTMNDILSELPNPSFHRKLSSTYTRSSSSFECQAAMTSASKKLKVETITICTDCYFLLNQVLNNYRQRHLSICHSSTIPRVPSFHRTYSSPRSTSNNNLSSPSASTSSFSQQQQRKLSIKTSSSINNLKAKSANELSINPTTSTTSITSSLPNYNHNRVSLSRQNLFLKLKPAYDMTTMSSIKTG